MEGKFPNRILPYVLLFPSITVVVIFLIFPSVQALRLSFFEVSPFTGRGTFVGLANFRELLSSELYRHSLSITLLLAAGIVGIGISVSLAAAVLANQPLSGLRGDPVDLPWP